ncbi:MAG: respiratory chain complex I subunit 1 family protein [Kiritimatiellia bacterium]
MNALSVLVALVAAPLFPGIVNQTKACFAGRSGPGLFRLYFDLAKLMRKSCPRSTTTTWLFDLAPSVALAAALLAALVFPWTPGGASVCAATCPAVVFFYLLGTGRFFTVLGALDTGSAFAGMGASREVQFSALVEPAVFVVLGFLVLLSGDGRAAGEAPGGLAALLSGYPAGVWSRHAVSLLLAALAFFAILLSETSRVPFDDPETHLELTMIHEAMVLDNSGPDLAYVLYGAALRFELLAAFLVAMVLPHLPLPASARTGVLFGGVAAVAVAVGVVESCMARMRFLKTPQILLGVLMLATLGVLLFVMF